MYTPEEGINLDMLREDVRFLKTRYSLDPPGRSEGRLVIRYSYNITPMIFPAKLLFLATRRHPKCTLPR